MRKLVGEPVTSEALGLVTGVRQAEYGDPLKNYERFARYIEADLNLPMGSVSRRQAIHVMLSLKKCRDITRPKRDNEVDFCGYTLILQMDREAEDEEEEELL